MNTILPYGVNAVLVDEVTQSVESEVLLSLRHSKDRIILVGNHKQLAPQVRSQEAKALGLHISLLERLINAEFPKITQKIQYCMTSSIAEITRLTYQDYIDGHH